MLDNLYDQYGIECKDQTIVYVTTFGQNFYFPISLVMLYRSDNNYQNFKNPAKRVKIKTI